MEAFPAKNEVSDVRADEDGDDKVPIVVHGEQHDKVRNSELAHVQQRADSLLEHARAEGTCRNWIAIRGAGCGCRHLAVTVYGGRGRRLGGGCEGAGVLRNDVAVVFFAGATEEFEEDYQEDYTDAGACEHAFGCDVP